MDLKLREEMQLELKAIQRDVGITFVFVTHDQGEALSMSSRVAVFNEGRIEQVGTPRDIYERPTTAFVAGFVGTSNLLDDEHSRQLLGIGGAHTVRPERIEIASTSEHPDANTIIADGTVVDLQYLGAECRVRVALAAGLTLIVSVASDQTDNLSQGEATRLRWPRSAVFAVADSPAAELQPIGENQ